MAVAWSYRLRKISIEFYQLFSDLPPTPPSCFGVTANRSACLFPPHETCFWAVAKQADPGHGEFDKARGTKLTSYQIERVGETPDINQRRIHHL